jgi:hypothetical protein
MTAHERPGAQTFDIPQDPPKDAPIKSQHGKLLNALDDMQRSLAYALRRDTLAEAEQLILRQEQRIAELEAAPRRLHVPPDDIGYPRDVFAQILIGNSPYAFYLFQWVPYQLDARRYRLKLAHDVRTFDGREALGIWPNANKLGPFEDSEVEFIRISRQQPGYTYRDPRPARKEPS